ncbi:MAG TPA: HAD family phosphatase [Patescibacteria group bacterium]
MAIIDFKKFKAVIFDMDGTMIDNMSFHRSAWKEFCSRKGIELTDEDFKKKIAGFNNKQIFENIFERQLPKDEIDELADRKESVYRELYAPHIVEVSGLKDILKIISELGIKQAIATTAVRLNRKFTLDALGIEKYFSVIVGDEDVEKGKPHPEIYLKTAEKLDVKPEECLVFEDSHAGVAAAKAAGMQVVAVLTSHTREELNGADYFIRNFSEIEI